MTAYSLSTGPSRTLPTLSLLRHALVGVWFTCSFVRLVTQQWHRSGSGLWARLRTAIREPGHPDPARAPGGRRSPPLLAAQFSNAVLAAHAFQHDADLPFSGMMPACGSANIVRENCWLIVARWSNDETSRASACPESAEKTVRDKSINQGGPGVTKPPLDGRCPAARRDPKGMRRSTGP